MTIEYMLLAPGLEHIVQYMINQRGWLSFGIYTCDCFKIPLDNFLHFLFTLIIKCNKV